MANNVKREDADDLWVDEELSDEALDRSTARDSGRVPSVVCYMCGRR